MYLHYTQRLKHCKYLSPKFLAPHAALTNLNGALSENAAHE